MPIAAPTLVFDGSKAPILTITVTSPDPRTFSGKFIIEDRGAVAEISYSDKYPFVRYEDTSGRIWKKISDDGTTAVFTSSAV